MTAHILACSWRNEIAKLIIELAVKPMRWIGARASRLPSSSRGAARCYMPVLLRFDRARYEMASSCSRLGSGSPSCANSMMAFLRGERRWSPPADYPCAYHAARNVALASLRLSATPPLGPCDGARTGDRPRALLRLLGRGRLARVAQCLLTDTNSCL